ncbi:hypothetical protein AB0I66_35945 [Streptomyces sp. NPDC050439]
MLLPSEAVTATVLIEVTTPLRLLAAGRGPVARSQGSQAARSAFWSRG